MAELEVAREAQHNLDSQKQENLLLKETIDRLRFDLDEMRTTAQAASSSRASLPGSNVGTMSRDLAHELQGHLRDVNTEDEETEAGDDSDGQTTEGEDYVETIVTRRKVRMVSESSFKTILIILLDIETKRSPQVRRYDSRARNQGVLRRISSA